MPGSRETMGTAVTPMRGVCAATGESVDACAGPLQIHAASAEIRAKLGIVESRAGRFGLHIKMGSTLSLL